VAGGEGKLAGPTQGGKDDLESRATANVIQQVWACIIEGQHGTSLFKEQGQHGVITINGYQSRLFAIPENPIAQLAKNILQKGKLLITHSQLSSPTQISNRLFRR
jgi:S1-C subfamily serine protease